jgi:hypothetical protein
MLANDWTGQLARERVAEFHRQAQRQRLIHLARARHRGGDRGLWWGRRLLADWLQGSGEAVRNPSTAPSTARTLATPQKEAPTVPIPRRGGAVQQAPSTQPGPVWRRLHQRLAAGSLIVAPLVLLAGELLHPPFQPDPARQLAVVAANPDRWYLAHLLSLIGFALLVPGILGLAQLVGQRRAALADLGGALALLGVLAITGLLSIDGFGVWQMAQPAADRAEMAALLDRIFTSPGVVPLVVVALAFPVGLLVLTLGLYRAQLVPAWTAGLVAIGVVVWFTGEAAASKAIMVAGVTILALGLGLTGRHLLTRLYPTDTAAAAGPDPTAPRPRLLAAASTVTGPERSQDRPPSTNFD